jgi:hypothetical protein
MMSTLSQKTPVVFISHKHIDSSIADVIREFIESRSAFQVNVFQSSSPFADSPKAGKNLNKQLIDKLWNTDVLILVYTVEDHNWKYCMWECGVAVQPESPDTKIILFQCGSSSPPLFNDQVNVNARNIGDIQRFINDFLTSPDFFPGLAKPIAACASNSPPVITAANEFFQKLQPFLPPEKVLESEEWPAYPFLQIEISLQKVSELVAASKSDLSLKTCYDNILDWCFVSNSDKYCGQLFNALQLSPNENLRGIEGRWRDSFSTSKSKWVETLCNQILAGAKESFPPVTWELMEGNIGETVWFAPMVNRVRKIPSRQCMQFDIYFYKFNVDSQSRKINISLPHD